MLSVLNVARPLIAARLVDPERVPPPGLFCSASAIVWLAVVTRLPPASRTSTWTGGLMVAPLAAPDGCTRKPSCAAGPTVTLKAADVAPVSVVAAAVSVYPAPALSIASVPKLATPATAATLFVPPSVPAFGLVPIASVTVFVAAVTRLPPASRTSTWTAGAMATPPVVLVGCTRKASFAAGPTETLNAVEVAPVATPVAVAVNV